MSFVKHAKVKLERFDGRFGARMGRPDLSPARPTEGPVSVSLGRVRLSQGGYDPGGAYWGLGQPLWRAVGSDGSEMWFRAPDRAAAVARIERLIPGARLLRR
jgi:hypothetical protein